MKMMISFIACFGFAMMHGACGIKNPAIYVYACYSNPSGIMYYERVEVRSEVKRILTSVGEEKTYLQGFAQKDGEVYKEYFSIHTSLAGKTGSLGYPETYVVPRPTE